MNFFLNVFELPLFMWALLAGIASSFLAGAVGIYVVTRRIAFISGSIAHSILGGMGFFLWLQRTYSLEYFQPLYGALLAAILSALLIAYVQKAFKEREDSIIATIWAAGMSIGIIFISKTAGYTVEITNLLIGNILWVTETQVWMLLILTVLSLFFIIWNFQKLKLIVFDEDQAKIQGISVDFLYTALLVLVAICVVALMYVVGIVLVMTMLTLPQILSGLFFKRISSMMISSIVLSLLFTIGGLASAYAFDFPPGATIALFSVGAYALGLFIKKVGKRGIRTLGTL